MAGTISIEGLDGSGKSSAIEAVDDRFEVKTAAEPYDPVLNAFIESDTTPLPGKLFAFMLDRSIRQEHHYRPTIKQDDWLVIDRYVDSTMAYQRVDLREFDMAPSIIDYLMKSFFDMPERTILLDVPVDTAISRISLDDLHHDRQYLKRVRAEYFTLAERYSERIEVVDGTEPMVDVHQQVVDIVAETIADE